MWTAHLFPPCVLVDPVAADGGGGNGSRRDLSTCSAVIVALAIATIPVSRIVVSARTAISASMSEGLATPHAVR